MRIAILSFYSGHNVRGVETWVSEFTSKLSPKYDVKIYQNFPEVTNPNTIVTNLKVDLKRDIERQGLVKKLFLDYWSLMIAKWTVHILTDLWKHKPDIVIPTNGGWQVALIRLVTWVYGGKMVIVGHSGKGWDERNNLWSFPDVFVALTQSSKKWAYGVNPFIKVEVIPDGVNLIKFIKTGSSISLGLPKPIVLAVGALEESKRLDLTIEAVSNLKNVSLLIIGNGPEQNSLEKLGRDKLGKRFMIKSVKYDEIPKYYRACDVFTLASAMSEAFGIVYIEAMASGLSVVATDDDMRKEIIGDAGVLVDPTNTDDYVKALQMALKTKWGNKPRLQAEKFSWDKVIEKYDRLFTLYE